MDHHGITTRVNHAVTTSIMKAPSSPACISCRNFNLDIFGKSLDLAPGATIWVEHSHSKLGKIRHEDIVEVDENALPARINGNNSQCK